MQVRTVLKSTRSIASWKMARQQARKIIEAVTKGLAKGSRDWRSSLALRNTPPMLVVTGQQCKVLPTWWQESFTRKCLAPFRHKACFALQIYPPSIQSEAIRKESHLIPLPGLQVFWVLSLIEREYVNTNYFCSCDAECSTGQVWWANQPRRTLAQTCTSSKRT